MKLTSNFENWINGAQLNDYEAIYSLYRSVLDCDEYGNFLTTNSRKSSSEWIVKSEISEQGPLFLANEKIKYAFLKFIEEKFCGDLGMEGWYIMNRSNSKT